MSIQDEQQGIIDIDEVTAATVTSMFNRLKETVASAQTMQLSKEDREAAVKSAIQFELAQYGIVLLEAVKEAFKDKPQ